MTWVRRQPAMQVHKCPRPMREAVYRFPSASLNPDPNAQAMEHREQVPDGQVGDLWRCPHCRALWLIAMGCPRCTWDGYHGGHYAGLILRKVWMPARWWQRLAYVRKGRP